MDFTTDDGYILSISKVAQAIDVSTLTLKRWYKWYENDDYEKPEGLKLPEYKLDNRRTKYFRMADVATLEQFKEDLQGKYRGCMSEFNAVYQWGQVGTRALENKRRKEMNKDG